MLRLLLDTCTISDFVRGDPLTLQSLKNTSPSAIAVSAITHMEIEYGLHNNPHKAVKIAPIIRELLSQIRLLTFGEAESKHTADIRASLKTQGMPIGAYDALIAGTARAHNLTVITSNLTEFSRVPGLTFESWRTA